MYMLHKINRKTQLFNSKQCFGKEKVVNLSIGYLVTCST